MKTQDATEQWLKEYLSQLVGIDRHEIDPQRTFAEYGLESGAMMGLTADLEQWLNAELSTGVLFEHPTIAALAAHVHDNYESFAKP
jgi:acyl carrier protein